MVAAYVIVFPVVFFELAGEDLQLCSALRTHFVGRNEGVHLLDVRKLALVARAVPGLRLLLLGANRSRRAAASTYA
jgi:hypothetical protein